MMVKLPVHKGQGEFSLLEEGAGSHGDGTLGCSEWPDRQGTQSDAGQSDNPGRQVLFGKTDQERGEGVV